MKIVDTDHETEMSQARKFRAFKPSRHVCDKSATKHGKSLWTLSQSQRNEIWALASSVLQISCK